MTTYWLLYMVCNFIYSLLQVLLESKKLYFPLLSDEILKTIEFCFAPPSLDEAQYQHRKTTDIMGQFVLLQSVSTNKKIFTGLLSHGLMELFFIPNGTAFNRGGLLQLPLSYWRSLPHGDWIAADL